MAIRPVKELPVRKSGRAAGEPYVAADMREFVRKGMDVAVLEYDGRKAGAVVDACKRYIKAHPDKLRGVRAVMRGVRAVMRGGKAYVWREVER